MTKTSQKWKKWTIWLAMPFILSSLLVIWVPQLQAQLNVDVQVKRWLSVQSLSGDVEYFGVNGDRVAEVGDVLIAVGDGVRTGENSASTLQVDTGIGTIALHENTDITVQSLGLASDGGYITHLYVSQGGVTLNLRRFTHRGSELEIETPSGVTGVRGTEFGVIVDPTDKRTGIATESGEVYAMAESTVITVPSGFQTLMRPGEPPLAPIPIPEEPFFDYQVAIIVRNGLRYLQLIGQINPINQIYIEDELQVLNEIGEFKYDVLAYRGVDVRARIITPLGNEATYNIPLL